MPFVLALDHIGNVLLNFDLYGHGKLNLSSNFREINHLQN